MSERDPITILANERAQLWAQLENANARIARLTRELAAAEQEGSRARGEIKVYQDALDAEVARHAAVVALLPSPEQSAALRYVLTAEEPVDHYEMMSYMGAVGIAEAWLDEVDAFLRGGEAL